MRYLSVCSGIEAATCAWHALGWQPVAFSEIDPFASALLAQHYPHVPNLGDMTTITAESLPGTVDLLVGGTPCQSFSVAGERSGLDDPRGNLSLVFADLVHDLGVTWTIWENVPGVLSQDGGTAFAAILGRLTGCTPPVPPGGWRTGGAVWGDRRGAAWRVIDAQYLGVPQRRRRLFVVSHADGWRPAVGALWSLPTTHGDWRSLVAQLGLDLPHLLAATQPAGWRQRRAVAHGGRARAGWLTLRLPETPDPEPTIPSRLADLLEPPAPHLTRYALSPAACAGLLRRAAARGRTIPPGLAAALMQQAGIAESELPETVGALPARPGPAGPDAADALAGHVIPPLTARTGKGGFTDPGRDGLLAFVPQESLGDAGNVAPTLRSGVAGACDLPPAIWEARFTRNGRGAPSEVAPALRAYNGSAGSGDGAPLVFHDAGATDRIPQVSEIVPPLRADTGSGGRPLVFHARIARNGFGQPSDVCHALHASPQSGDTQPLVWMVNQDETWRADAVTPTLDTNTGTHGKPFIINAQSGRGTPDVTEALRANAHGALPMVLTQNQRGELRVGDAVGALAASPGMQQQPFVLADEALTIRLAQTGSNGSNIYTGAPTLDTANSIAVATPIAVRRLTPLECERLQGFPDGYTRLDRPPDPAAIRRLRRDYPALADGSDADLADLAGQGPRYRALGNSMAVPVMRWLARQIAAWIAVAAAPVAVTGTGWRWAA